MKETQSSFLQMKKVAHGFIVEASNARDNYPAPDQWAFETATKAANFIEKWGKAHEARERTVEAAIQKAKKGQ